MLTLLLDLDSPVPVYRQIADGIRALVAEGALAEGAELPSVRALGAQVGTSLDTVAKAYRLLSEEGLVELRHGAGARIHIASHPPAPEVPEADRRRLDEILSRLALSGLGREVVEQLLDETLDRFFGPAATERKA